MEPKRIKWDPKIPLRCDFKAFMMHSRMGVGISEGNLEVLWNGSVHHVLGAENERNENTVERIVLPLFSYYVCMPPTYVTCHASLLPGSV